MLPENTFWKTSDVLVAKTLSAKFVKTELEMLSENSLQALPTVNNRKFIPEVFFSDQFFLGNSLSENSLHCA